MRRPAIATAVSLLLSTTLVGAALPGAPASAAVAAPSLPAGFSDDLLFSLDTPTAITFTPDGRALVTQDDGRLRVARGGTLIATPALDLGPRACTDGERGLLGVAVDPQFATNRFIYLYWTHNAHAFCGIADPRTPENRVARYVLGDDSRVVAGSERVLIDHMPSPATNHNAGDLRFGADGYLYVSVGDGGCAIGAATQCGPLNTNSRRRDIPNGKILRVTRDGDVPATNPYVGATGARRCTLPAGVSPGTGPCTETFASGFRNPFRFAQRPGTSQFYVNDVGQSHWEEIDSLAAGRDYGWNVREGHCATGSSTDCGTTSFQNPIFDYSHADGCVSITGGAFVPAGVWPAPYGGSYLFADFVCGKVWRLVPKAGGGFTRQVFMSGVNRPVHLAFGPFGATQALYYLDYFGGAVHRVRHTASNTAPTASFTQRPNGLAVTLDGSASSDPDSGDSVTSWSWAFGDGTSRTTTTPVVAHTYPRAGTFTATLRVTDSRGAVSAPATRSVFAGEHVPTVTITSPAATARFRVGQSVTVQASATDPEDGALPGSSLTWTVRLRHGTHEHPFAGPVTGSSVTVTYPAPEDLLAATNSYLVVSVVARDSRGLTSTATRTLLPKKVTLTFASNPTGARLTVKERTVTAKATVVSWQGFLLSVNAPDQSIGGVRYVFSRWSDGGGRAHTILTPAAATTYTAVFRRP